MSYTIKICKECGQEFVPDSPRQIYCKREHYRPCPICGKPVKAVYLNEAPRCCSSICRTIKAKEAGTTKVCEICGKRFKVFGTQRYCPEPHFRPCPVCGKPVEYHKRSDPIQCCSSECKAELRKRTISTKLKVCKICGKEFKSESNTAKYCPGPHYRPCPICGKPVEFHSLSEPVRCCSSECKEKQKEKTCLVRYGEDVAAKSEAVRAKIQETCNSEPVVSKRISSCIAKYGVQNPAMAIEVRNKIRKTNLSTKSKKRYTLSMQSHYGVNFPMQSNVLKQKQFDTCQKRYNVPYACMLEQCRQKNHFIISNINKKVAEILKSYNIDVELEHKIDKYSYDIYLPKFKTFIEVNPTYTHNSVGNHWNSEGLDKYYHLEKTKTANEAGFRCIHLFDWDKIDMIADFFRSKQVVYARKCSICNIDKNLAGEFLSNHHLQGTCNGQAICLGLFYNDELVQVMTFGKPRYNKKYQFELLRLCSLPNVSVVGGAERLFSSFIRNYTPESIISYCDIAKFSGDVYKRLGFTQLYITEPNKIWSHGVEKITNNLLLQRGFDQLFKTNYGKGTNNEDLMITHGWLPVFDCGQAVYVWNN